jgi:xylulokinase
MRGGNLFAGLDVSTQSCKLVVIDPSAGTILHADKVEYDTDLPSYGTVNGTIPELGEGVSESDPRMWVDAVETALTRMVEAQVPTGSIRSVSVSGQQHGLVALAADGTLARPRSKLWNDMSTQEECRILTEALGGRAAMIREVGNSQRPGYTASKILHMVRHEPQAFRRSTILFLVHNFINWYLTGGPRGGIAAMEPGDVSGMALWHPGLGRWSDRTLEAVHPDLRRKLPPILPSNRSIGPLAPALVERFGFPPDCTVDAGSGDNMCGAVGTGNVRPGIVTVSLGTSGTAFTFLEEPFIDPTGEVAAFADSTGHHLPLVCISNLANGYDAFLREHQLTHAAVEDLFLRGTPGSGGRVVLPWFQGERTPDLPDGAPIFFGFQASDFRPELMARALVEGHALSLFQGFARLPVSPTELRLTGGLSGSRAWCQAMAEVFGTEAVPVRGEGAALGAALHAAWVWGREGGEGRPLEEISDPFVVLEEGARCRPTPEARPVFAILRRLFGALSARVRGKEGEDPFALRRELLTASGSPRGE